MEESILGEIPELNPFQILENQVRQEMKLEFLEIYNNNEMFYKKYISFLTKSREQKDKEIEQLKNKYNFFLETKTDLNK
jgi:vacuolar-type H+-ATPase subunit I/STV1